MPHTDSGEAITQVSGPITAGRGQICRAYFGDLNHWGYTEEEFFIEGVAHRFRPIGELGPDGKWRVEKAESSPFKTRAILRRPIDPSRFNGTVVCEWLNVSDGFELSFASPQGFFQDGFAQLLISAQYVGVHGLPSQKVALTHWDPERYGSLSHPGDSYSYDIFRQVAAAVTSSQAGPLEGYKVRHLIATGASQSAARLLTYTNAIQPLLGGFDAFLHCVGGGMAIDFEDFIVDKTRPDLLGQMLKHAISGRLRSDLSVPVMFLNSESETLMYYPMRQSDSDTFRYWEIAGASHGPKPTFTDMYASAARDQIPTTAVPADASEVSWLATTDAAIHHIHKWVNGGPPPPSQPPINVAGAEPAIVRDANGNATGGIRLPELESPIATHDAEPIAADQGLNLWGKTTPFPSEKLNSIYPDHATYVDRVLRAADNALKAGVILPYRVNEYRMIVEAADVLPG